MSFLTLERSKSKLLQVTILLQAGSWSPPPPDWIKVNVDMAHKEIGFVAVMMDDGDSIIVCSKRLDFDLKG
ncbi:hypothetical protein FNV43_RR06037 [Rhamnella rubrinervis]|uniref:Uncharacterized protein n=1 Tax=Rhamnella rubrinervis TaxID=2594499 RepID=A0A8K0HD72_9ROSA|nr:hypothetical protein FNV43_RR06037 [Rhamnella rubrinervis]